MYYAVLTTHSWLRWAVVAFAILATLLGIAGLLRGRPWTRTDDRVGLLFIVALDLQLLLGLLLYLVYSPYTALAMDDFGGAMRIADLRFWAVEHPLGALVGIALAHVGRARIRRATDARRKHRTAAIFFGLALLAIFASIPWPGTANARPLFPR